jgi:hypothetical protein
MSEVGAVYQKLVQFLEASGAIRQAQPQQADEPAAQSASI